MSLEGFKEFYFIGTVTQKKELIEIHKRNGCPPRSGGTYMYATICFEAYRSIENYSDFHCRDDCKTYTEAKEYLLSFAKPVKPAKTSKPAMRKKAVAVNQGFVIDGVTYTKTHISGVPVEQVKQELKTLRLKLDRHTRLNKDGALDNR